MFEEAIIRHNLQSSIKREKEDTSEPIVGEGEASLPVESTVEEIEEDRNKPSTKVAEEDDNSFLQSLLVSEPFC